MKERIGFLIKNEFRFQKNFISFCVGGTLSSLFFKALEYGSLSLVVISFIKNDPAQAEDPSLRIRMSYHTSLYVESADPQINSIEATQMAYFLPLRISRKF